MKKCNNNVYKSYRDYALAYGAPFSADKKSTETPEESGKRIARETLEEVKKQLNKHHVL